MSKRLEVRIVKKGKRTMALTTDGVTCFIKDRPNEVRIGDRWTANAIKGKVKGESGHSTVELKERIGRGFLDAVTGHWIDADNLAIVQMLLNNHKHPFLMGPPGTGKTLFLERFASDMDWGHLLVDCNMVPSVKAFFGADAALGGKTQFIPSELVAYLDEVGEKPEAKKGIITDIIGLDEPNRASPEVQNGLFGLLGPKRQSTLMTIDGPRRIVLPRNVGVMLMANVGRDYSGTSPIDRALDNRTTAVMIDYAPVEEQVKLLNTQFTAVREDDIKQVVLAGRVLAKQYEVRPTISNPPGYRGVESALIFLEHGWSVEKALRLGFLQRMNQQEKLDMWGALQAKLSGLPNLELASDLPTGS